MARPSTGRLGLSAPPALAGAASCCWAAPTAPACPAWPSPGRRPASAASSPASSPDSSASFSPPAGPGAARKASAAVVGQRRSASEREKLRMRRLAQALRALRRYLPASVAPPGQTLTKVETLRLAVRYIAHLADLLAQGAPARGHLARAQGGPEEQEQEAAAARRRGLGPRRPPTCGCLLCPPPLASEAWPAAQPQCPEAAAAPFAASSWEPGATNRSSSSGSSSAWVGSPGEDQPLGQSPALPSWAHGEPPVWPAELPGTGEHLQHPAQSLPAELLAFLEELEPLSGQD